MDLAFHISDSLFYLVKVLRIANLVPVNVLHRWVWLLDDSVRTISHDLYSNTIGYNEEKAIDPLLLKTLR